MWKPLVVLAIVANTALITPSEGTFYGPYPEMTEHGYPYYRCKNPNEVFDHCPNPCPPRECGINKALILCAPPPKPGSKDCKPGCRCKDGFLKNKAGICIPENECKYDCAKNETLDLCYSDCPPRFCGVNIAAVSCLAIEEYDCERGCRCSDGYLRNAEGKCILEKDCPKCRNRNEVYDVCPAPCPPRRCDVDDRLIDCMAPPRPGDPECKPGCRCADGHARNDDGICIPRDQCPQEQCRGPNEEYNSCPNPCPPQRCDVDPRVIRCKAPPQPGHPDCEPGCQCIEGHVRNDDGICIPRDQCPEEQCRGPNEGYNKCLDPCPLHRCDVNPRVIKCKAPPEPGDPNCHPGCECFDGYARNDDDICIPRDQCPQEQCRGPNEMYNNCPNPCPPKRCDVDPRVIRCLAPPEPGDPACQPGCECFDGYARNDIGICIPRDQCPEEQCRGPNEMYNKCPNPCPPKRCDVDPRGIRCPAPPEPGDPECQPGCECFDGYARNDTGICIPRDQCPQNCKEQHEIYSKCPALVCRPLNCTQIGFPQPCPHPGPDPSKCPGKPGCICDSGYARSDSGKCIPLKKCPTCGGDPNAVLGSGNCGRHCFDRNKKKPVVCTKKCKDKSSCKCRKGFWYDDNTRKCVLACDCTPTCGKDEVYSACTNSECRPKNCSQLGFSIPCPRIDPENCIKGCLCKEGFVRAANGTCIPKNKCPSCGGDPRAVSGCGNCRKTCSNYNSSKPMICTKICNINGCDCREGLVLDDSTGKCIHPKKCVSCGGDYNAKPGCDKNCTKRCPGPKPAKCKCNKDGCVCKDGFIFDPKPKKCVRPEQCTPPCGTNEVLSNCSNGGCGPWRCTDVGHPTGCVKMDQKYCTVGCVCQEGYVRDENERCIPIKDCPQVCKEHEVYSECTNGGCEAKNCSQLGQPVPCIKLDPKYCIKGCVCEEGYLFARNGTCVPIDQCDNCNKPHEHYDPCAPSCPPQTCESIGRLYKCPITAAVCKGACRCDREYFRNKKGECIRKQDCLKCRGAHEYFSCGSACDNVCSTLHKQDQTNCPIQTFKCVEQCYCEKEYARDRYNVCIPIDQCPTPTCGKDEVFSECINGGCQPKNCSQLGKPVPCVKIDPKNCIKGCLCKEGYLRDSNGICVPKEKCGQNCTGQHEVYDPCPPSCPPQTCESINKTYHCPLMTTDKKNCKPACRCKEGFLRDKRGQCISKANCLKCTGPNEYWSCGGACDNVCKTLNKQNQTNCPIINIKCNEMCYCEDGYARNKSNICIPIEKCSEPTCGLNEVYDSCANGGCQKRNCSQVGQPTLCIDPLKCIGGCVCQEGYLRDKTGSCVPEKECPLKCTKRHEVYDPCPRTCPPQTCDAIGIAYPCPNPPEGEEFCHPACRCEDGYYRNSADECISEANCLKCTKPNEHFSCGPECDNVCATLSTQNRTNCPIKNKRCIEKCYCDDNYARDYNDMCIPIDQCNVSCKGDPNAVSGCGVYCKRCSNYKREVACPLSCLLGGCDCKPGYIFDDNLEICVLPENCTPVCKENEVYNTCINGGCQKKKCSDLGRPDICVHPKECIEGCLCKKGFLKANNGTCVPINKCPKPVCPKHEVFDTCANGGCNRRKCSELTAPVICRDPLECIGDCVCIKGRLRNEDGVCVPERQCNPICPRPHEVYNPCPSTCPPQTCESLDRAYVCPIEVGHEPPCEPGCVCEEGFFKNKLGECISRANCLKCMGQYEYFSCGVQCDNVCEKLNEESKDNCPYVNIQCHEKCYCEDGYARNKSKICIPIEDCPPSRCGPDERWEESPCQLCEPLTCSEVGKEMDCPPVEDNDCDNTPACICKYGLVRNDDGVCIPISECSSDCVVNVTEARARLNQGIISLSGKFLQYLNSQNPDENSVASSTSLMIPLAQLTIWAKEGPVLDELLNLLNLKCKDEIKAVFQELTAGFKNQSEVEFEVASKYYANENYPLSDDFKTVSAQYFDAEGQNVDFKQSKEAADIINAWVSDRTRGKIQDLVNQDTFNADTRLCLVNAIYFLGNWVQPFDPKNTQVKDFHKSNGETVPLKIMFQQKYFNYAENDKFQVLEMLYKGNNFSFVVFLPRTQNDFLPTLATISEPGEWDKIMDNLTRAEVKVSLPKMLIKTDIDLKQLLNKYGVSEMFEQSSGFEGLLQKPEPVSVSDAVQQAYIAVDELGTEAAAATAITVKALALQYPPPAVYVFEAIHPFIFYIMFGKVPLFCGLFVGAL